MSHIAFLYSWLSITCSNSNKVSLLYGLWARIELFRRVVIGVVLLIVSDIKYLLLTVLRYIYRRGLKKVHFFFGWKSFSILPTVFCMNKIQYHFSRFLQNDLKNKCFGKISIMKFLLTIKTFGKSTIGSKFK